MSIEAELKRFHTDGSLSLFVGAGVSVDCGLPDWTTLSKLVVERAWPGKTKGIDFQQLMKRIDMSSLNPLDSMRMARRELGAEFNSVVTACLYEKGAASSRLVQAIVALKNVRRICCFNYDDLLEDAYSKAGVSFRRLIVGEQIPVDGQEILIFHPHGFLPRNNHSSSPAIILSEDDYHELYMSLYSWANLIQLNLLLTSNVLFIGCSLKDPNIRRLLDVCKKTGSAQKYFAVMKRPDYESEKRWFSTLRSFQIASEVEEPLLRDRGVIPIWVDKYSDIPSLLTAIS
jgi:SIR2-like protein